MYVRHFVSLCCKVFCTDWKCLRVVFTFCVISVACLASGNVCHVMLAAQNSVNIYSLPQELCANQVARLHYMLLDIAFP